MRSSSWRIAGRWVPETATCSGPTPAGATYARRLVRQLVPGVLPGVLALAALGMSGAIIVDAGLSYLGLGVPLPTPSWGRMVSDAQTYVGVAPWLVVAPGVAIALAVVG